MYPLIFYNFFLKFFCSPDTQGEFVVHGQSENALGSCATHRVTEFSLSSCILTQSGQVSVIITSCGYYLR